MGEVARVAPASYLSKVVGAETLAQLSHPPVRPPKRIAKLIVQCPGGRVHVVRRSRTDAVPLYVFCPECGFVPLARALLLRRGTDPRLVAVHMRALAHASTFHAHEAVVTLRAASRHPDTRVRLAAAEALGVHPYPAALEVLEELTRDKVREVWEAAERAFDAVWAVPPECLQCGSTEHSNPLTLEHSHYPSAFSLWPAFCSHWCAAAYALDRVQEDLDADQIHECLPQGRWVRCAVTECDDCLAAELVGRGEDVEVTPKKRRRARSPARGS